jgi:hypothetical protein
LLLYAASSINFVKKSVLPGFFKGEEKKPIPNGLFKPGIFYNPRIGQNWLPELLVS